ncbi:YodL domain-containing protein [Caproiciproducens sp. R1]|uniref:YodL domain-containing protein n=1 Tax=Caproiciproducens sp. R1 TaxID=3435000 RepID=UPI00403490FE
MASCPQNFPFGILDVVELLHLKIRRRQANSIYVDCPICGDKRGKMNVNFSKNVWHCNYCDEGGGMLALYAKVYEISTSDAYREICEALQVGGPAPSYEVKQPVSKEETQEVPQSERAGIQEIHQTLSLLFGMLSLSDAHRKHLRLKRGLTDAQIDELGYKSTPPPCLCRSYTERLLKQGCTGQGVPGFYLNEDGKWTVKFYKRTAGIIIPVHGIDGLIRGAQIRLDVPIKNKDDPPDKEGTKYIWLSSSNKKMGVTSGSPIHFVGNPFSRVVYVTEGYLKADVSHYLIHRSFAATAGANNVSQLGPLFAFLSQNGTEVIVEAEDMDKFRNDKVTRGASQIYLMARQYGMECRRLTWNPNYKGIDDWQLALHRKNSSKEDSRMNFKQQYLSGQCDFAYIDDCVETWHKAPENGTGLVEFLGLTEQEYESWLQDGSGKTLQQLLEAQRRHQHFRIYQLEFTNGMEPKSFAFLGIKALRKAGYLQPPAAEYRLMCNSKMVCPKEQTDEEILRRIFNRYNDTLPKEYPGRSIAPSDVVELYDEKKRSYFYRDTDSFVQVRFSPFLALPIPKSTSNKNVKIVQDDD